MRAFIQKAFWFGAGILCGYGIVIGIGFYKIKKDSGLSLVGPKVLGDIRIYQEIPHERENSTGKECKSFIVERKRSKLIQLDLNEQEKLVRLLFYNDDVVPVVQIKYVGDEGK